MPILNFKGKAFLKNYHNTVKFHTLIPDKDKSVSQNPSLDDNLIIHGDNLIALKALLPTHAGKIKCIYIDPPYNTGNENWIYNDNVNSPMILEWLGKVVSKECLARHDKWCCMMYPRLVLLRELLRDDGVIFVSIDDNEVHHLRMLMDEIFGEDNFIASISWQRKRGRDNSAKFFSKSHEYIICYSKFFNQAELEKLKILESTKKAYKNTDNDHRGKYRLLGLWSRGTQGGSSFAFTSLDGKYFNKRLWLVNEDTMKELDKDNRLVFVGDKIYRKLFLSEHNGSVPETIWTDSSNAANAADEMKLIFGEQIFETPKPTLLLKKILKISLNNNDIILDSFAGSGTTAHAVLDLNAEDYGNRKFILIECEDYADKITAERVRRVINGVPTAKDEKLKKGLAGSFSFYNLGKAIDMDELLEGKDLPSFDDLSKYVFFTATGQKIKTSNIDKEIYYIGSAKGIEIFLMYEPDKEKLKKLALNLGFAEKIGKKFPHKRKLVFSPCTFLDEWSLREFNIDFAQLPYAIYRYVE